MNPGFRCAASWFRLLTCAALLCGCTQSWKPISDFDQIKSTRVLVSIQPDVLAVHNMMNDSDRLVAETALGIATFWIGGAIVAAASGASAIDESNYLTRRFYAPAWEESGFSKPPDPALDDAEPLDNDRGRINVPGKTADRTVTERLGQRSLTAVIEHELQKELDLNRFEVNSVVAVPDTYRSTTNAALRDMPEQTLISVMFDYALTPDLQALHVMSSFEVRLKREGQLVDPIFRRYYVYQSAPLGATSPEVAIELLSAADGATTQQMLTSAISEVVRMFSSEFFGVPGVVEVVDDADVRRKSRVPFISLATGDEAFLTGRMLEYRPGRATIWVNKVLRFSAAIPDGWSFRIPERLPSE